MIDPWRVIEGGMVPYWCESSSTSVVEAAELWLAGSEPFETISVLPDPPGSANAHTATLAQWRAVAAFARRNGTVDTLVAGRYPLLPPAAAHAGRCLGTTAAVSRRPAVMPIGEAVRLLTTNGPALGILVT